MHDIYGECVMHVIYGDCVSDWWAEMMRVDREHVSDYLTPQFFQNVFRTGRFTCVGSLRLLADSSAGLTMAFFEKLTLTDERGARVCAMCVCVFGRGLAIQ